MDGVLVAVEKNEVTGAAPDESGRWSCADPAHQPSNAAHFRPRCMQTAFSCWFAGNIHIWDHSRWLWKFVIISSLYKKKLGLVGRGKGSNTTHPPGHTSWSVLDIIDIELFRCPWGSSVRPPLPSTSMLKAVFSQHPVIFSCTTFQSNCVTCTYVEPQGGWSREGLNQAGCGRGRNIRPCPSRRPPLLSSRPRPHRSPIHQPVYSQGKSNLKDYVTFTAEQKVLMVRVLWSDVCL